MAIEEKVPMARIPGVNPDQVEPYIKKIFEAQTRKWGGPLGPHLLYAHRPSIFRGVQGMWTGVGSSGLIDARLQALINRRVAAINGCEF
jgi:alkylhydroperoxidase family enzyme